MASKFRYQMRIANRASRRGVGNHIKMITVRTIERPERKRLVCAYPRISYYAGQGSTDDPARFVCRAPS